MANALAAAPGTTKGPEPRSIGILELLESNASLFVALGVVVAYCPPLMRSLWVDEAGTYWMACKGHLAAIQRTSHWPGQSILYAVITSFFCFDGSPIRDTLLRIPALLGAAAACYILYRFAEDAFGAGAGRIAAILFAFSPSTVEFATEARPYSLAMAAVAASCWTLYRWANSRGRSWLVSYVISSALVFYFHYMFSPIFVAQAVFLVYEMFLKRRFRRSRELLAGYLAIALLVIPIVPHILLLLREAHTMAFELKPSAEVLAGVLMPPVLAVGLFASALLVRLAWPDAGGHRTRLSPALSAMLLAWWSAGPLLLFVVSSTSSMQAFAERYLSYSGLALVLLLTYLGHSVFGRRAGLTWALLAMLLTTGNVLKFAEAREPGKSELGPFMRVIRDESVNAGSDLPPVLYESSLGESDFYNWRSGNSPDSYLYDPFVAYPMKNRLVPLPFGLSPEVEEHVRHLIESDLKFRNKVILVIHNPFWIPWFVTQFEEAGFADRIMQPNTFFYVMVFERRAGIQSQKITRLQ